MSCSVLVCSNRIRGKSSACAASRVLGFWRWQWLYLFFFFYLVCLYLEYRFLIKITFLLFQKRTIYIYIYIFIVISYNQLQSVMNSTWSHATLPTLKQKRIDSFLINSVISCINFRSIGFWSSSIAPVMVIDRFFCSYR